MRVVVCTTEGTFRSDVIPVEDATKENIAQVHKLLSEFTSLNKLSVVIHGNTIYFNPNHVVWVKVVEHDEPF